MISVTRSKLSKKNQLRTVIYCCSEEGVFPSLSLIKPSLNFRKDTVMLVFTSDTQEGGDFVTTALRNQLLLLLEKALFKIC